MGSQIIPILSVILAAAHIAFGEVWEFGAPHRLGSQVVTHEEGSIGLFERTKRIHLRVPQCYAVTYVRVKVKNIISSPKVQFNIHTNEVVISYRLFQNSISSYDILGKGVWRQGCIVAPLPYMG